MAEDLKLCLRGMSPEIDAELDAKAVTKSQVLTVRIDSIKVNEGRRAVNADKVKELADSIRDIGLLNPIVVTEARVLVAGAHRLAAARLLGWTEITATVKKLSGMRARLAEIDENLIRAELHYAEHIKLTSERQNIYLTLHPETKAGIAQALSMNRVLGNNVSEIISLTSAADGVAGGTNEIISSVQSPPAPPFTVDTASKTGVTRRTVEMDLQIAHDLASDVLDALPRTNIPKTDALKLSRMKPENQRAIVARIESGAAKNVSDAIRKDKIEEVKANLESISAKEAKAVEGVYDVIVLDPPWIMEKIERDVAPEQTNFDYPTMGEEELAHIKIPAADNCHVFVWTTHKHLPVAFRLLDRWGFKYVCTFVWHKNGGYQPFGLPQYNNEFCLYAHKGNPQFVDFKDFFTCFNANRTGHSEKPEAFYEMLRRVTAGRRLDMFNRRKIDGFDGWGNEADV
jgi:ParB/RepB/Spo0J family partition protein